MLMQDHERNKWSKLILCHMTFDVARIYLNSIIIFSSCTAFILVFSSTSNEPIPKTCEINNLCINFPSYLTTSLNCQTLSADQLFNTFFPVCFSLHYSCISLLLFYYPFFVLVLRLRTLIQTPEVIAIIHLLIPEIQLKD